MTHIDPLGSEFIEQTKYSHMGASPQDQGAPFPEHLQPANPGWVKVALPDPADSTLGHTDLRHMVEGRRSVRHYSETPISLEELSYLLWMSQGIKKISQKYGMTFRTVPSAGSHHPFETYLSINRVQELEAGLYHFMADTHQLEIVSLGAYVNQALTTAALEQQHVASSAVTFIWVANPYRTSWRYGSRAYRYLYLDAGHACQNLYLAAESIDSGVCAIGAYDDDLVNKLIGVDGVEQFAIYLASLGKKIPINAG